MNKDKISSPEIIDLVSTKLTISKRITEDFLKNMFLTIEESLLEGNSVKINNFGTFKIQWNEPRKSVNVNTGKEIILDGFNKIVFTPDNVLKDIINEPFAHLESAILDNVDDKQNFTDPLKVFTVQALEIKNILSEINSTSKNTHLINEDSSFENELIENDEDTEEIEETEEITTTENLEIIEEPKNDISENQYIEPEINNSKPENEPEIIEEPVEDKVAEDTDINVSSSITDNKKNEEQKEKAENVVVEIIKGKLDLENIAVEKMKNKRIKISILLFFFLFIGGGILLYYYNLRFHSWINKNVLTSTVKTNNWQEENMTPSIQINSVIADSVVSDSNNTLKAEDLYDVLFEKTRKYEDLITIDRTRTINSLTSLSEKFYGHKDFWVYIYEANMDNISDPDNIKTGTLIKIPRIDVKLIDVNNPRSFQMAQKLNYLLLKKANQTTDSVITKTEDYQASIAANTKSEILTKAVSYIESVKFRAGDRLTIFSRRYYGHKDFWIYIFEANKDVIKNPNVVPVGTIIKIPKMDPALVDARNPECIKKAKLKYENYLQKSR